MSVWIWGGGAAAGEVGNSQLEAERGMHFQMCGHEGSGAFSTVERGLERCRSTRDLAGTRRGEECYLKLRFPGHACLRFFTPPAFPALARVSPPFSVFSISPARQMTGLRSFPQSSLETSCPHSLKPQPRASSGAVECLSIGLMLVTIC